MGDSDNEVIPSSQPAPTGRQSRKRRSVSIGKASAAKRPVVASHQEGEDSIVDLTKSGPSARLGRRRLKAAIVTKASSMSDKATTASATGTSPAAAAETTPTEQSSSSTTPAAAPTASSSSASMDLTGPLTMASLFEMLQKQKAEFVTEVNNTVKREVEHSQKETNKRLDNMQKEIDELRTETDLKIRKAVEEAVSGGQGGTRQGSVAPATTTTVGGADRLKMDEDFNRCRRTIIITGIKPADPETDESLAAAVEEFLLENMSVDPEKYDNLGPITVSRPATRLPREKAPVELYCKRVESRDFLMSCMGPLSRAEPKWSKGRIQAKYPVSWMPKFKRLTRRANELRAAKAKDIDGVERQLWYTQIRYSDCDEGLTIFIKNLHEDAPWLPMSAAEERWPDLLRN